MSTQESTLTLEQVRPFVMANLKVNQSPALIGPPGIGKSSMLQALAKDLKTQVFTLAINQLADRSDLTGVWMTKDEKTGNPRQDNYPHVEIMNAIEYALAHPNETPILFLDEFNRAPQEITSAVLSFQTERRIGNTEFPPNLRIVIAGNDKGNVSAIDDASTSRFAVYRVTPDVETFLAVNSQLNPFVLTTIKKHAGDLTAEFVEYGKAAPDDKASAGEESADSILSNFASFGGAESFEQITCPRTITNASKWLDALGIDKSGSQEEREVLTQMFAMNASDDKNAFLVALEGQTGKTTFTYHVFDEIQAYFHKMLASNTVSTAAVLEDIRPSQTFINELSYADDVAKVELMADKMTEEQQLNMMIWLLEATNVKEINNNNAVSTYLRQIPNRFQTFPGTASSNLMRILPNTRQRSNYAIAEFTKSSAPVMASWLTIIKSITEE